ncbi:leucyl aminopeptidase [Nocardioides sp. Soil805]|uniref:leucyl aminopeptidase n=1 Tax=Nocardioides sp. Soil805 TaxID=1736416 RepID=UPI0007031FCD|nr:leucyl aminopeptidase [Nocardioides sp. Soil805]KRF34224.1 aminopeptidase [Nocardioides sp. Soil805]
MTTTYTLRNASPAKTRADAVVVGVLSSAKGPVLCEEAAEVTEAWGRKLRPLLSSLGVTGRAGESTKVPTAGVVKTPLLVLVGLGAADADGAVTPTAVRRAAGVAARSVPNAASVALALPAGSPELVAAATEGHLLGGYTFTRHKSGDAEDTAAGEVVVLSPVARKAEVVTAFEEAQVVASAVLTCRDWVNEPPGHLTPPAFADAVTEAHRELTKGRGTPKVTLEVLDEHQLAELGCGGTLAVGNSSDAKPRMVRLTYAPKGARRHLALVGKGVTFDSGGLTIKPSSSMVGMKGDMAGAAAVITATFAIARLGLPIKVTAYAPMAENMVSGTSMRPGDVITMYGGTTVEIANTDAEGRMLLGDALQMASETGPDVIVDIATLTGHMQVALGDRVGAVLGTGEPVQAVLDAGEVAGEQLWPMPIPEEMKERITSSKVADLLQHDWVRWGGGLYASAFLREFTGGLPWAHMDIAGNEINGGGPYGHVPSGATGFGVTTLVAYARSLAASD